MTIRLLAFTIQERLQHHIGQGSPHGVAVMVLNDLHIGSKERSSAPSCASLDGGVHEVSARVEPG